MPTITVNFDTPEDKETTSNVLRNIKHLTGDNCQVILNKALRKYYEYIKRLNGTK